MSAISISIDGELVPPERATISVLDRGLLYGDGVFEVLRTWRGVAVDLDAHLARLEAAAAELQLRVPGELRAWTLAAIAAGLAVNAPELGDVRIRILVTRGPGPLRARLADLPPGRAIAIVESLPPRAAPGPGPASASASVLAGIALAIVDHPVRPGRGKKTLAYLDHLVARELAAAAGADDAIRLTPDGQVAECATASLFVVAGGRVRTPPLATGALPGVTRARVLAAAARLGLVEATEAALWPADVAAADELFVTSAVRGVVPVTRVDGKTRARGPITERLADVYADEMSAIADDQIRRRLL